MSNIPNITLNDGNTIPQLGFGVFQVEPQVTAETVAKALAVGYRHIDTAEMYQNESQVGEAIKASGIPRNEIFITSKLNNSFHKPDSARQAYADTLSRLQTDYIDLFLIHWPLPTLYDGDFVSTWKVLEEFKKDGRAKSVGVSNFQPEHLDRLAKESDLLPAVNQVEIHPYFINQKVSDYDREHNIVTEAWSPLAQGSVLGDSKIAEIASTVGKTAAQVVLRWHIQKGYVVFPKSITPERIAENFNIFDFSLNDEQMKTIDSLDKGESGRTGPNPDNFAYIPA